MLPPFKANGRALSSGTSNRELMAAPTYYTGPGTRLSVNGATSPYSLWPSPLAITPVTFPGWPAGSNGDRVESAAAQQGSNANATAVVVFFGAPSPTKRARFAVGTWVGVETQTVPW